MQLERGLKLQGYIEDSIRAIGRVDEGIDYGDLLADWRSLLERPVSKKTNLHRLDHFYRTLNFDQYQGLYRDPDGSPELFRKSWEEFLVE